MLFNQPSSLKAKVCRYAVLLYSFCIHRQQNFWMEAFGSCLSEQLKTWKLLEVSFFVGVFLEF